MVNDRFIRLLTKELCDELTESEREELTILLRDHAEYRAQKEILKDYWETGRGEYEANAAMFKRVTDKIKAEEMGSAGRDTGEGDFGLPGPGQKNDDLPGDGQKDDDLSGPGQMVKDLPGDQIADDPMDGERIRRIGFRRIWYGAAAVVLLLIGALVYYSILPAGSYKKAIAFHWLQKSTQLTKKSVITLSDGTVVTLNSATTLKYPDKFGDSIREIYLDGEAYFDVTRDPLHPFIIHANKINIRVLGTSFNVKSYQNEPLSEATLIRGSVEVTLNDRPSDRIILKPKEKLIVQNNVAIKKRIGAEVNMPAPDSAGKGTRYSLTNLTYFPNTVKTVVETSWVENKLVFSDKDFVQLSGQLERWYGVHIEFGNERVKEYRFTGFFEKESLSQALDVLKMIEPFNYKISDSMVYIY